MHENLKTWAWHVTPVKGPASPPSRVQQRPQSGTIDDDKRTVSVGPMNETLPSPRLPSGGHTTVGKQARVGWNLGETKKIRMEKWSGMAMQDGNGMKSNEFLS